MSLLWLIFNTRPLKYNRILAILCSILQQDNGNLFYHTVTFSLYSASKDLSGIKMSYIYIFSFIKGYVFQITDLSCDNKDLRIYLAERTLHLSLQVKNNVFDGKTEITPFCKTSLWWREHFEKQVSVDHSIVNFVMKAL